jgi:hypothetical protein
MTGKIARLFLNRGFGFIFDEARQERFFSVNDLTYPGDWLLMYVGQEVTFEPVVRPDGKRNGLGVSGVEVVTEPRV